MNQEQNNYNNHVNNVTPNNQPLQNNQNLNNNSYPNQPIDQNMSTQQEMNNASSNVLYQQINSNSDLGNNQISTQQIVSNSVQQNVVPPKQPKKNKVGLIVGIVGITVLVIVLIAVLIFISSSNENIKSSFNDENQINTTAPEQTKDENEADNQLYSCVETIGLQYAYVNYRNDRSTSGNGTAQIYVSEEEYVTGVAYDMPWEYTGDLDGTVLYLFDFMVDGAYDNIWGAIEDYPLQITDSENVDLNGYKAIRFFGTINNSEWDCDVYGYSMLIDDVPLMVAGISFSEDRDQSVIDMMIKEVEAMADTVRTEK